MNAQNHYGLYTCSSARAIVNTVALQITLKVRGYTQTQSDVFWIQIYVDLNAVV